jgi:iron complex outermembrane recepter protein
MESKRFAACLSAAAWSASAVPAYAADESPIDDLRDLSIEELTALEVRSASKQAEPLTRAPTAIFVITGEDVVRSAASSLPEALRLAPNLQVQRVDARQYAVTARGFNGIETANKLLVLIDGRSVYTPLHSGVFWELHNPMLGDLQQIEVISGPGGTLYGPNAVNGVVSITTRNARDTIGGFARGTVGDREASLSLRYGVPLGGDGAARVYGTAFHREGLPAGPAAEIDDEHKGWQAGFRVDWQGASDDFTLQGDLFDTEVDTLPGDGDRGHNLLGRWTHRFGGRSSFQLQAYYDDFRRRFLLTEDSLETFDLEAQYNRSSGAHDFVAGLGLRSTRDEFINNLNAFQLNPRSRRLWVMNAFAQDRLAVTAELDLIAGIKLERSSFTGVEVLPNLRLAWHPDDRTLFWGAVSRAVRTPSRIDRQLEFPGFLAQATNFESEKLIALEAGYRGQPSPRTSLSVSLFFNLYDDIRTTEFTGNPFPIQLRNSLEGRTYGVEAWAVHQLASWWRATLGFFALGKDFHLKAGAVDIANRASLGTDPDYQILARSNFNLTDRLQLDLGLRGRDDLGATNIGGYVEADGRLSWQVSDSIELYAAGANLLHRTHAESSDPARGQRSRRSVFAGTRLRF